MHLISLAHAATSDPAASSPAAQRRQTLQWKSRLPAGLTSRTMALNMCIRYASLIAQGAFSDHHTHLQQQLQLHALLLLQVGVSGAFHPGHAAAVRGPAGSGAPLRGPLHPALPAARRQPSPLRDGQSRGDGRAAERCAGGGGGAARGEGAGLPAHGGRTHRGGGEDAGGLVADALAAVAPGEVRGAAENAAREDRRRVAIPHFVQRALRRGVSCRPRSRGGIRSSAM